MLPLFCKERFSPIASGIAPHQARQADIHIYPASNMENLNSQAYLDKMKIKAIENLRHVAHAPSVQMQYVPVDGFSSDEEEEDDTRRISQKSSDRYVIPTNALSDSEDEGDNRRDRHTSRRRDATTAGTRTSRRTPIPPATTDRELFREGARARSSLRAAAAAGAAAAAVAASSSKGRPSKRPEDSTMDDRDESPAPPTHAADDSDMLVDTDDNGNGLGWGVRTLSVLAWLDEVELWRLWWTTEKRNVKRRKRSTRTGSLKKKLADSGGPIVAYPPAWLRAWAGAAKVQPRFLGMLPIASN
ncbi:hypothetical protein BDK51DRAFT_32974 [Blyttiomyces helicus]|uniref:Uncharacterized protein n=1 Tax=Blyttiomyces helicus TaxID=388810 RepID=A0A4P9VXN0_9FUNG|nr:hypothetical protein BDK51DRAFT_32974 [Blyttiomyces helicus]|eukprot:RKO84479.1 hypothetical protein BDK51DRAFT_32974 [Blyttiomyces helicus]